MKIGTMQPYFLPYIGYFSLLGSVQKFVFLDDVQYIRRGWVNRNRIKINNEWKYVTLPIEKEDLSANINEVFIKTNNESIDKIKKTIDFNYARTPFFKNIKPIIFDDLSCGCGANISFLNISIIKKICNYLDIKTEIWLSSEIKKDETLHADDRIIEICRLLHGDHYINPIGGTELYSKEKFGQNGLLLSFIKMNEIIYNQGPGDFIPNLSILDVLSWNSKDKVKEMLVNYTLIDGK
jgi:hypothetical protein